MLRASARTTRLAGVAVALALVAAACGSSSKSSNKPSGSSTTVAAVPAATINGSGSTFQQAYEQTLIAGFKSAQPNVTVNYAGGGSGKGLTDLQGKLVDYAGSDTPIKASDLPTYKGTVLYFPIAAAPITVSFNLSGVSSLQLSADTIAKIFQAQITSWNDPAIKADNPGASLPSTKITVAHRSDGSGTTASFTKYLTIAAPSTWKLGTDKTVAWPPTTQAGNGNTGVAQIVKTTNGAVGYVDFSDAQATGLNFAAIKNKAGKYVAPSLAGTSAAVEQATINPDLTYTAFDEPGDSTYPIATATWILTYAQQTDHAKGTALKAFLAYVLSPTGQNLAGSVQFASLPANLIQKAQTQLNQIVVP